MRALPQGWYLDPYEVHEDRYFSGGRPTKLVRDDGVESYDPPPDDEPVPDPESLVEVPVRTAGRLTPRTCVARTRLTSPLRGTRHAECAFDLL